jgi:membrane protein implicated in regulation of membrane protease activity
VAKKRPPLIEVVWWAAFALALRCVFESVMDPYYVVPSLVLVVIVALSVGKVRFLLTVIAAAVCTKTSYWHTGEWRYYLFVIGSLLLALAFSWPGRRVRTNSSNGLNASDATSTLA